MIHHQYKDYSEWMEERDLSTQKDFWLNEFSDELPVLDMPLDFVRPKVKSFYGSSVKILIEKELKEKILELGRKADCTEYMIFLSAIILLLGKYSNQEDIIVGSPASARTHRNMESMMGMFSNTLAMRGKPVKDKKYIDFLHEMRDKCLKAYKNQEYPFEALVEAIKVVRDSSRNPLFDVMLVFRDGEKEDIFLDGFELELVEQECSISKFDLTFNIEHFEDSYSIELEYCTDLYKRETAQRINEHYVRILEEIVDCSDRKIEDIDMITEKDRLMILNNFNNTKKDYIHDKTIIELFEEQVERTPDDQAVLSDDECLSYAELNRRANCLASRLRELGVGANDFVVLIVPRSVEMLVGVYGVMKAGGVYVPVGSDYPLERIKYILADCKPKVILTCRRENILHVVADEKNEFEKELSRYFETDIPVLSLDCVDIYTGEGKNLPILAKPEDLIYCIYTSGTTGKPKGVMNIHKGLVNRILWMQESYPLSKEDVILQKTSYTFDVSFWEIAWWGIVGAKVALLPPDGEKDPSVIYNYIKKYNVTTLHFVPSMLNIFLSYLENCTEVFDLSKVRYIFSSGEALNVNSVVKAYDIFGEQNKDTVLINLYGPTEASIDVTYLICNKEMNVVTIGKPIANTCIYIMNNNSLCGIGVPGEICITGEGLAAGYLNLPELTEEKFIDNPYGLGRMYRTGDLGRWQQEGNIEYLGRIDEQVKIRGFRIELGEIENQMSKIEEVKDCVVIAKEDQNGEKAIHAYIVSDGELNISLLREKLRKSLSEHMIPAYIGRIDKIPVTVNGKLDRRALPDIKEDSQKKIIAPRNKTEQEILEVWKKVLNTANISVTDNFFDVGGNSLSFIKVFFEIDVLYPDTIKIVDLFSYFTIRSLVDYMLSIKKDESECNLTFTKLSDSYFDFSAINRENINYKIEISDSDFENIMTVSKEKMISIDNLLSGIFVYFISDISRNTSACVCTLEDSGKVKLLNCDMAEFEDMDELYKVINFNEEKYYDYADLHNVYGMINTRKNRMSDTYITPLIVNSDFITNKRDIQDYFEIACTYKKLQDSLILEFFFPSKLSEGECAGLTRCYYSLLMGYITEKLSLS